MAEKISRNDLRRIKAERDLHETKLREAVNAAKQRLHPLNLTKEAAGHVSKKAKTVAVSAKQGAKHNKGKLIAGAVVTSALLAYSPIKNFLAKRKDGS